MERSIRMIAFAGVVAGIAGCGGGGGSSGPSPEPTPPANGQPTVAAIADPAPLTVGETLEVAVSVSDPDASDTHTLSASSGDDTVATVSVDDLTLVIEARDSGITTITVSATDSSGRTNATSASVSFDITVQTASGWVRGVFADAADFMNFCEVPRTGTDSDGEPFPDRQGATLDENNWLRSWSNDTYLWYDEIEDLDPGCCDTLTYFGYLKTEATTASGAPKDQFHYVQDTAAWIARSRSGVSAGYGARFAILARRPPRDVRIAYTEPDTPATHPEVGLLRGTRILEVDGASVRDGNANTLNAGFFPGALDETHEFVVQDPGSDEMRTVTMRSAVIRSDPVQHVRVIETDTGPVGYLLFNSHIATAERRLVDSIRELAEADVEDLVLDLRYNGGGYLVIASQLAYMIAGASAAQGRVFSELKFNDKHPTINPVTGELLRPSLFQTTTVGLSSSPGASLPTLDLDRVFILAGPSTCSASESIINGLRGIDVEVILVGGTTCGKPYGFYPQDNCGTTYFTVQFKGVNDKGFGDYADGFTPESSPRAGATVVPGCGVEDDFDHQFGDPDEARLAAALDYRTDGSCPETAEADVGRWVVAGQGDAIGPDPAGYGLMVVEKTGAR